MNHQDPFASTEDLESNPFEDPRSVAQNVRDRETNLDERERELAAREVDLKKKQAHLQKHGRNNWPFFFPIIFHSIVDEIPEPSRPLITRLYQLWLVLFGTLLVNMVACIFILISGSPDGGHDLGSSIGYVILITPLSFLLWYRPIYNGYMKEQALYYYMYFIFCGFHLLFSVYMILGIPSTGSAGLIQTIQAFSRSLPASIIGIVATTGWILQGAGLAWYYRQIWNHHEQQGHSFTKAKGELAEHGTRAYFTRG